MAFRTSRRHALDAARHFPLQVVRPKYAEALRLAAESLLTTKPQASAPLPHIFGSAAYLQDHTAGLGSLLDPSLAEQQSASAQEEHIGDASPDVEERQQPASDAPQTDALQASIEALQGPTSPSEVTALQGWSSGCCIHQSPKSEG